MHPPLEVRQHPTCKEYILALKQCHADNPIAKFWGVCNDAAIDLNLCLKEEKVIKRAENRKRLRQEQERLRARFEAKRQAEAAAAGGEAPQTQQQQQPPRVPGYWIPEQRGIPKQQPAPQ